MTNQNHPEVLTRNQHATYPPPDAVARTAATPLAEASQQLGRELDELEDQVTQLTERLRPALRDDVDRGKVKVELVEPTAVAHAPLTDELYRHGERLRGQWQRLSSLLDTLEL